MSEELNVGLRDQLGKRRVRRLRNQGRVPAVLYGHGEKSVSLSVPAQEIYGALRHGSKVVDLKGAVDQSVLIREVQWDVFGIDLLHIDFIRVSADERVVTTVMLEIRGIAPGVNEGGVVEQMVHEVEMECPVASIPEKLEININALELGESIKTNMLSLPTGAKLTTSSDLVVVQCVMPKAELEEEEEVVTTDGVEPEVIGRKEEEDEDKDPSEG